jgi:hypothetical protein
MVHAVGVASKTAAPFTWNETDTEPPAATEAADAEGTMVQVAVFLLTVAPSTFESVRVSRGRVMATVHEEAATRPGFVTVTVARYLVSDSLPAILLNRACNGSARPPDPDRPEPLVPDDVAAPPVVVPVGGGEPVAPGVVSDPVGVRVPRPGTGSAVGVPPAAARCGVSPGCDGAHRTPIDSTATPITTIPAPMPIAIRW